MEKQPIAFFIPTLAGGGAEKAVINLMKGMLKFNIPLDLLLADAQGPYLGQLPKEVRSFNLKTGRVVKSILPLSKYLKINKPQLLISHLSHANVAVLIARELARVHTPILVVEHSNFSASYSEQITAKFIPTLMKTMYSKAEAIIGVSQGIVDDLESQFNFPKHKLHVIYNPVVDEDLYSKAKMSLEHPWFQPDSPPVFLAVGRLTKQKDFNTLIEAFAIARKFVKARLIILGEGELRTELELLIRKLGLSGDILMPGFVDNPYMYMSKAKAFVLSSLWEGLPTVLIEAMACGCPVISTDCPSGPKEILENGKYGTLIPVGDTKSLSLAMLKVLENSITKEMLQNRANDFSRERSVHEYITLGKLFQQNLLSGN